MIYKNTSQSPSPVQDLIIGSATAEPALTERDLSQLLAAKIKFCRNTLGLNERAATRWAVRAVEACAQEVRVDGRISP